jgi:hypothetical protein
MSIIQKIRFLALIVGVLHAVILNAYSSQKSAADAPSAEVISQRLEELAVGKLDINEAQDVVRSAGDTKDVKFSVKLKLIAVSFSIKERNIEGQGLIAFDALNSLRKLGETKEYFLRNAKNYHENPLLAYYSILILACSPTPEIASALPGNEETLSNNLIHGALENYRRLECHSKAYQLAVEHDKRFNLLAMCARSGWSQISDVVDPELEFFPEVIWGQGKLYDLSKEDPAAVAKSIFSFRPSWIDNAADLESLKKYYLRHVVDQTRSQFKLLNEAEAAKSQ